MKNFPCFSGTKCKKTTWFFTALLFLCTGVMYSAVAYPTPYNTGKQLKKAGGVSTTGSLKQYNRWPDLAFADNKQNRQVNFLNSDEKKDYSLFRWRKEEFRSLFFEWGTLVHHKSSASSPNESRIPFFSEDSFWYFHVEQPTFLLPYFVKWGVKASVGMAQKKKKNNPFLLFTLSHVWSVEFFQPQFVVPFVEVGASVWNRQSFMKSFSEIRSFFSLGATFSFSILKPSLSYTLRDEYNIRDMGVIVQIRTMKTHKAWFYPKDSIKFLSVGLFVHL